MNIALFGFKKCGKTYYGMKLAQKLHRDFIDSDHLVEELYAAQYHEALSYRDIVKKHGFSFFREMEKHAVSVLVQKRNRVISLGGGVVLDPENISRLEQVAILVYVKPSKATLRTRILSGDIPYYFDPQHPGASFEKLYAERIPLYEKVHAHCLTTDEKTEEEILQELEALAQKQRIP